MSEEIENFMLAKVNEANLHKTKILPYDTTIYDAVKTIKENNLITLLLEDTDKNLYIVTDSDFREKVILNKMSFDDKVGTIANPNPKCIKDNDFLFDAQLQMNKYGLKRMVVKNEDNEVLGIVDQIALARFFTSHTFFISHEIDNSTTIEELKSCCDKFTDIIFSLHEKGVKVYHISKLINQLNRKVMDKLFLFTAPKELLENYSLIVMGSEGRVEQILKTDQDNALIITDSCKLTDDEINNFTKKYTEHLVEFGFPRCEGNIMLSNPYWCKRFSDFKSMINTWVTKPSMDNFMNLAIFFDAVCASGNRDQLNDLKNFIFEIGAKSQSFYMNFAKIITEFSVPLGFFDGFVFDSKKEHKDEIDIKKGALFIIVQSIRVLCLENKILRTNTSKRLEALNDEKVLDEEFTQEIDDAFNFLSTLKLDQNLKKIKENEPINNYIKPKDLSVMEKDMLKDSFKIVNRLKKKIESHYNLNYL